MCHPYAEDAMDFRGCKRMVLRESTIADDTCDLLSSMFETDGALQCVRLHEVKLGMVWGHVGRILQSLASACREQRLDT